MRHLGDITKIHGDKIPPVDVITGGSPCQDLSVAGKRAGLDGERSGLFLEQIRIVKEMRDATGADDNIRLAKPRYMIWENVPGAFSSNKGKDFQAVLTEIVRIAQPDAPDVPMPKNAKWGGAGCIYDELGRWSVAWRVHDAQFWGVPQRRKRIALVADFAGLSAAEILFERKGLHWNPAESGEAWKDSAADVGRGAAETSGVICLNDQGGQVMDVTENICGTLREQEHGHQPIVFEPGSASRVGGHVYEDGKAGTLRANAGDNQQAVVYGISAYESNAMKSSNPHSGVYVAETARTLDLNGGSPACNQGGMVVVEAQPIMIEMTSTKNTVVEDGVFPTLTARMGTGGNQVNAVLDTYQKTTGALCASGYDKLGTQEALNDMYVVQNKVQIYATCTDIGFFQSYDEKSGTLLARQYKDPPVVAYSMGKQSDFAVNEDTANTINASGVSYVSYPVVRRLTPLECERLQGFPDGWTDIGDWVDSNGKKHKGDADSPRYKALGNSIALPFWQYLARQICAQYERDITIGSLFDGIGGFPYVFERCGAKAVWASEIEEFPIAVTKEHFPEGGSQ